MAVGDRTVSEKAVAEEYYEGQCVKSALVLKRQISHQLDNGLYNELRSVKRPSLISAGNKCGNAGAVPEPEHAIVACRLRFLIAHYSLVFTAPARLPGISALHHYYSPGNGYVPSGSNGSFLPPLLLRHPRLLRHLCPRGCR